MKFDREDPRKVRASVGATAWLNAAIASSNDKDRKVLYRTLSVEFYRTGIQFIGCDGHALFRTWAPYVDIGDLGSPHPTFFEMPEDQVIVADPDKFALGFMGTLLSACTDTVEALTIAIEHAEDEDEPALGEDLSRYVLTLHAVGQRLSCPLFEGTYPDWRRLAFGVTEDERVEGITLAPKLFKAVGKLKGVSGVDCTFRGEQKAIAISSTGDGDVSLRGLLMPMLRPKKERPEPVEEGDAQLSHDDGNPDGGDPFPDPDGEG